MRLLRLKSDGEFSLVEFVGNDIPRYAILSHTWGLDHEEVTFKDLMDKTGKTKAGYRKICFCGEQASKDGLLFFWVDTCCIDKSSSAELTEAINSMFRWYLNAAKCYVFLSDVSGSNLDRNGQSVWQTRAAFRDSKWFTRGWTLQELVAPKTVEFFSREGHCLGNKMAMVREIQQITGISVRALQGYPLAKFSVDDRMSWAKNRHTKRDEDSAYSLLGIFDVHMPLIYGEGREKALARLQKEIQEPSRVKPRALSPELSTRQHNRPQYREKGSRSVTCFKCGGLGHYAYDLHCYRCGNYGHYASDDHCYKCGKYGHYANEPHCYRCNSYDHFVSDCPA
ncbi:hypothetical protein B7463_g7667, partial [Scytalidium lignicola]